MPTKSQAIWNEFRGILASNAINAEAAKSNQQPQRHNKTKNPKSGWCAERVELLKKLWADGFSAGQIARKIEVTRNAVIGKVHRLRLTCPNAARRVPRGPTVKRSARIQLPTAPHTERPPARILTPVLNAPKPRQPSHLLIPVLPSDQRITLTARPEKTCCFLAGDPRTPDHTYCGAPATRNGYCDGHYALMHQKRAPKPIFAAARGAR
jgi:GcrA cell cycle regulator